MLNLSTTKQSKLIINTSIELSKSLLKRRVISYFDKTKSIKNEKRNRNNEYRTTNRSTQQRRVRQLAIPRSAPFERIDLVYFQFEIGFDFVTCKRRPSVFASADAVLNTYAQQTRNSTKTKNSIFFACVSFHFIFLSFLSLSIFLRLHKNVYIF